MRANFGEKWHYALKILANIAPKWPCFLKVLEGALLHLKCLLFPLQVALHIENALKFLTTEAALKYCNSIKYTVEYKYVKCALNKLNCKKDYSQYC